MSKVAGRGRHEFRRIVWSEGGKDDRTIGEIGHGEEPFAHLFIRVHCSLVGLCSTRVAWCNPRT